MSDRKASKPRLLVLASTYPRWAGDHEPAFVHELASRLTVQFEITVVCPHAKGAKKRESLDGVDVRRYSYAPESLEELVNQGGVLGNLKRSPWKLLIVPFFLLAQLYATAHALWTLRPQLIHAHWLVPQGLVAIIAKRMCRSRAPLLVTSHGADLFSLKGRLFRHCKRFVLRRAAAVTVVSRAMQREVHQILPEAVVEVEPMGVDLIGRFHPDADTVRVAGRVLFVGRLVEKKGVRQLIQSWPRVLSEHPGASLEVVGFGPLKEELEQLSRQMGLDGSVRFLGAVANDRLPHLYRSASCLAVPFVAAPGGDQEGLGLVMVEAIGCGCRVVAGDVPAVHDVITANSNSGTVTPVSSDALAKAIVDSLSSGPSDPADVARFDWVVRAGAYRRILEQLAGLPEGECPLSAGS